MADKKKMSVEEILAACRQSEGKPGGVTSPSAAPAPQPESAGPVAETGEASEPVAAGPAAAKPKPAVKPGAMSVADILAAARAGKASGAQPDVAAKKEASKSEPKPESKPKPAAAPQAKSDKAAPKPAIKAAPAIDTASILAAARKSEKPGPISKAEAAAKGKSDAAVGKKKLEVPPMPQRPAFAKPVAQSAAAPAETRRGFFAALGAVVAGSKLALGFSSLAVTHLLWALGLARFMFPNILTEPPTRFKVGFPDTLAPGQVDEKYKAQFGVWIVKYEYEGQPEIYALKTVCTHLGCTPNWLEAEQKFKCPCHGSGFYKDGINFEGPAPRPLERYAIRVADDGQLEVDKSRTFHEETGNWRDPASFVPA